MNKQKYRVHVGYTGKGADRWRCFPTLEAAQGFCEQVFKATRVVLSIQLGVS